MEKVLISVIVPVYKVEPYLRRCVDSILCQTYRNLEIILVDDGSPDGCPAICDEYAAKDSRVRVIHKENGGLSSARNAGLDYVFSNQNEDTGGYIAFIDSDDYIHPQYFEVLHNIAKSANADIAHVGYQETGEQESFENVVIENAPVLLSFAELFDRSACTVMVWAKLYRRELLRELRFRVPMPLGEDLLMNYSIYDHNPEIRVANIPVKMYYYFLRSGSIMREIVNEDICRETAIYIEESRKMQMPYVRGRLFAEAERRLLLARYFAKCAEDNEAMRRANALLRTHWHEIFTTPKLSIIERLAFPVFLIFPCIYRRYLICIDPTYLQYEERLRESRSQHK